jgi:c-di-GMP-binding flagellar brake protein YcgR
MTTPPTERRARARVAVNVPVKVRRNDGSEQSATTRDLSSNGVFMLSESALEAGTKLELVVMLPKELGIGAGGWALCQASVVRVEPSAGGRMGVAAALDRIELLPELA